MEVNTITYEILATIFGAVGGIFAFVAAVLAVAFSLLMKYNIYGYGIKKFVDNKGDKQWQFWVLAIAQAVHIFIMTVFNVLGTLLLGVALNFLLAYYNLGV